MILSKGVASFNVRGLCLVDALLTLGQEEQVPLGIEYISREALAGCGKTLHGCHPERSEGSRSAYLLENAQGQILRFALHRTVRGFAQNDSFEEFFRSLLEKPISEDFHDTTVGGIVQALLDGRSGYTWRVRDGVLNVSHRSVAAGKANLFDRVLPEFVIRRCSVADASNVLYMSLNNHLHPEVTGYAGEYDPGDPQNLIGPLELRNAPVRQVLNRLVSSTKKGAWVVRVQPCSLDQLPSGGLWTIIEYETPPRQYAE
jgi:hypothetical protein